MLFEAFVCACDAVVETIGVSLMLSLINGTNHTNKNFWFKLSNQTSEVSDTVTRKKIPIEKQAMECNYRSIVPLKIHHLR